MLAIRRFILNIFHISDLHFTPNNLLGISNIEKIFQSISCYKKDGDLLLISGDILNKDFADYQPIFNKILALNLPFLCCTGNHDKSTNLISALKKFYPQHPIPISSEKLDFVCNDYPLKFIVLDSFKENAPGGDILPFQLAFLEKEIVCSDKPVVIMIHQFPLDAGLDFFDKKTGAPWRQDFVRIVSNYTIKIKLIACGHLHNSVISQIAQTPVVSAFSANWQADLDFSPLENIQNLSRPVGYYIHRFDGQNLVSFAMAL